jgi:hypothetical protein
VNVERGADFEACYDSGVAGQVGTVSLMLVDNDGGIFWPADTDDIVETPAGSGIYCANRTAPIIVAQYTMVWSIDGTYDPATVGIEDLFVLAVGTSTGPPLVPGDQEGGPSVGPCFGWVAAEDVAECCSIEVGSTPELFEPAATSASQLLYMLSGKQWKGSCERVVRPHSDFPCGLQVTSGGYVIGYEGAPTDADFSKVLLPNYPVTEIVQVLIDGVALAEDEYRLDGWRWLQRMDDADGNAQSWPGPQRIGRNDTEEDTWSIRYMHGQNPPQPGVDAAAQLACEIYKSCPGNEGVGGECKIPSNATRVTAQGITIELGALHFDHSKRRWDTGMKLVDSFLNAYNPDAVRRQPLIWSPDHPRMAREVGTVLGS